jgi:hypothetical protein
MESTCAITWRKTVKKPASLGDVFVITQRLIDVA